MIFLGEQEKSALHQLSILRNTTYVNKNGNRATGRLWLIGDNDCVISDVSFNTSQHGMAYIAVTLTRKPCYIYGVKTKVSFAPYVDYVFNYKQARELCFACGYELKQQPSDMLFSDYFRHVYRRINTFIGTTIKVAVTVYNEPRKDDYGNQETRNLYYDTIEDIFDWRMRVSYNMKKRFDYSRVISKFV